MQRASKVALLKREKREMSSRWRWLHMKTRVKSNETVCRMIETIYVNYHNQMSRSGIILFLVFVLSVSAFNIKPLRAGTIRITDADIRSSSKIYREIHLHMKKDFYEAHKAINVIASITSLAMDDRLNFYFQYNITCPQ